MLIDQFKLRSPDDLKKDRSALEQALQYAGCEHIRGNEVRCPFCDDKKPSGSIYNRKGWRYKCHSCSFGGSVIDVIAKADGIKTEEVFQRLKKHRQNTSTPKVYASLDDLKAACPETVEAVYQYTSPKTGKPDMIVIRYKNAGVKTFRQAHPVDGGFVMKAPPQPWSLYNRARIQTADTVVVVEGEKCVHALHDFGIVATTSPAGAGKAHCADWSPLAGKNVILWPDHDDPGRKHMKDVEAILQTLNQAPRVAVLNPSDLDLQEKEDAADYIKQLRTAGIDSAIIQREILELLNRARPRGICCSISEQIEAEIKGKRKAIAWPWKLIGSPTKALLPGTLTILCGSPGASKSLMLLEVAAFWHREGIPIALYELEDSREYHLRRTIAQQSEQQGMTDPEWTAAHPDQTRQILADSQSFAESFGCCIEVCPDTMPTMAQVAEWIRKKAKAGSRIIGIDPVTAAEHTSARLWEEDNLFLQEIKRTATEFDCSIILVTHPTKTFDKPNMNKLAGSAAFARFAQTILWLENHDTKKNKITTVCGTVEEEHNRSLHILKARNGKGQGMRIAYSLNPESITFMEHGIIVKKKKK